MNNQVDAPPNAIRYLREQAGLTQEELGRRLGVDGNTVSRWELGRTRPRPSQQRGLAREFSVSLVQLQIPARHIAPAQPSPLAFLEEPPIIAVDTRIADDQAAWIRTRKGLNKHRAALTELAVDAYLPGVVLDGTTLLAPPSWIPDEPVGLADLRCDFEPDAAPVAVDGTGEATAHVRPLADLTRRYPRYTAAVRDLARPRLYENRLSWRLLNVDGRRLTFADACYFDTMDVHEAVGHEMAYVHLNADGELAGRTPALRDLPLRRAIADPFALTKRPCIASISTLFIRGGDRPTFLLHRRDASAVAIAGSMLHVVPTGIFQPSSLLPSARDIDFDPWRNIQREISEELFGDPEHDGEGQPIDYTREPFATLDEARERGDLRVWYLGTGLDALTLAGEILTACVLAPNLYDRLAPDFVLANDEGRIVAEPAPLDEATVRPLIECGRLAPAAAGAIALAWQHRSVILG